MLIDFTPLTNKELTLLEFAGQFTAADLRVGVHASVDHLLALVNGATDAQIAFSPDDPDANDPYAVAGEETIGWTLGHLIAHVTASSEEGAAYGSLLARGVAPADKTLRLRYETPWREMATRAQCIQRLEESRRIRLAYLDTWPDTPHLDTYRNLSERYREAFGPMNAPAAHLFGQWHEDQHFAQMQEALRQAQAALPDTTA